MINQTIAFIGAGNMAQSLIAGLIAGGTPAGAIRASDPATEQRDRLREKLSGPDRGAIMLTADNKTAIHGADVIVFAVKPQILGSVAQGCAADIVDSQLLLSIAAGVPISAIEHWCGVRPIVRAMPNTPALLGAGASALFANAHTSASQRTTAELILAAAGVALWVEDEADLDAVTAVSGSGPAYFFYLMEAMIDAGTRLGLSETMASALTLQTALGAARMAAQGNDSPATLRRNVTSPGGTTERALSILEKGGGRELIIEALEQAAARSRELAREFGR